jgi:hypothetical protein
MKHPTQVQPRITSTSSIRIRIRIRLNNEAYKKYTQKKRKSTFRSTLLRIPTTIELSSSKTLSIGICGDDGGGGGSNGGVIGRPPPKSKA